MCPVPLRENRRGSTLLALLDDSSPPNLCIRWRQLVAIHLMQVHAKPDDLSRCERTMSGELRRDNQRSNRGDLRLRIEGSTKPRVDTRVKTNE